MPSRAQKPLKSFLGRATKTYATGGIEQSQVSENSFVGEFEDNDYRLVDMYSISPNGRVFNGRELVFHEGEQIWAASYHAGIEAAADPDEVLAIYSRALASPAAELPIRGPKQLKIGEFEYKLDSVFGPLAVGRFAVTDYIMKNGIRVYVGHIAGGIMSKR